MASGSESATEDVVQALMETLVDPLLPLTVTSVPPSEDVQIAVAKEMHAVVLLYNYYLRKQKPELVFLEFVNFCKLVIVIRPPLITFMKMMKESKPEELSGADDWLSVTEKAIRDACDVALGLDASRDVPNIEGWPISKVAVLLIDSKKENCVLQFGAVTEGAWSLIEKELNESSITPEVSAGKKIGNKRKRDNLKVSTYNTEFLQLGYDTVKDVTGISSSDLEVLETHMTYSLSEEKSAACFYIMQCPGSFIEHEQVPLKFLVESVQGLLAEKFANGSWEATPSVKFHHMLPYVKLILCWLSGCGKKVNSSDKKARENCYSNNKCDDSPHGQVASPVDNFLSTEKDGNLRTKVVKRFNILDSAESSQNRILENFADGSEEFENGCDLADCATEVASNDPESGHSRRLSGKTVVDDNARDKFNENHDVEHSAEKDERRACPEILDEDRVGCGKDILSGPPSVLKTTHVNDLTNICSDSEDNKMLNAKIRVYHHRRKKNPSMKNAEQLREAAPDLKAEVDSLKSNHTQRSDEKVSEDEGYLTNTSNETGTASTRDQRAQLEAEIKHNVEVQNTSDSSRSNHIRSRDETVSEDKGDCIHECNQTGSAAEGNQLAQVEVDSLKSNHTQRSDEKVSEDEGYLTDTCNQTGTASTGDQRAQIEAEIKPNVEVQNTSDSSRSNHIRSRDETVSEVDDRIRECNQTGSAAAGNQRAQVEVDSLKSNHTQRSDEKVSGEKGYLTNTCNQTGTASTGDQRAQLEAKTKHNIGVQNTSDSSRSNHIRSRDEMESEDKGDCIHKCNQTGSAAAGNQLAQMEVDSLKSNHTQRSDEKVSGDNGHLTNTCNQTGTAATGNQLAQVEAKFKHDLGAQTVSASDQLQVEAKFKLNLGAQTISASDQVQNALALLYRKRRELYSQICNVEDALALCEDNVSRIRDGGEVDLACQCIKSVISGNYSGTQVQDNSNQQDENNCKFQHGKPTRLSEAYLPGNSSCQDLEYTCLRNDWRLPRYLIESSDGKFMSNVVVEGKDFKLHAKGGFESNPCVARETAAAEMIAVMHNTFP